MARPLRIEYPGAIYHITCRMLGDKRSQLFVDESDAERYLERLSERVEQFDIRLYMFVLMKNHCHLVLETPAGNCSAFMHSLSTAYTVYYNLRHDRHGHVFDGRFKSRLVEAEDYLLRLSRYVHLNPVKIKSMDARSVSEKRQYLRQYRWSSYPGYIGKRKQFDFVECEPIYSQMSGVGDRRMANYRKFVETGLGVIDDDFIDDLKRSPIGIGSESFLATLDKHYRQEKESQGAAEDVSFRQTTMPLSVDTVLHAVSQVLGVEPEDFQKRRRNSPLRAVAADFLLRYAQLTQRQVADHLRMGTGVAVSKQLNRWRDKIAKDNVLQRQLKEADRLLADQRVSGC